MNSHSFDLYAQAGHKVEAFSGQTRAYERVVGRRPARAFSQVFEPLFKS